MNLVGGSGDRRPFRKGKKTKKGKKVHSASSSNQTRKVKADQSGAEYFYCKKKGHWKRNYFLYQASLDLNRQKKRKQQSTAEQGIYMINSCNFSTTYWVLDTGSPIHICNSLQGLQVSRRFDDEE